MAARGLGVIGVPTSAGAFAPGQEQAPRALREAGLIDALRAADVAVQDYGDREIWRWRPDRENRRAQNAAEVVEIVQDTAGRVRDAIAQAELTLVIGGDSREAVGGLERELLDEFHDYTPFAVPQAITCSCGSTK